MILRVLVSIGCLAALCIGAVEDALADPPSEVITGPKLLCFYYSTFSLLSGESVTGEDSNFDVISIHVDGPDGAFDIFETGILRQPKYPGRFVFRRGGMSVYWADDPKPHYNFYGRTSFYRDRDRLLLQISGPSLMGKSVDAVVYRRLDIRDPKSVDCQHTFTLMLH